MENEREKQAQDFLTKTNTTIDIVFLKNGKHFIDDKEDRDIYKITLKRGARKYVFNFGQSIANSSHYVDVHLSNKPRISKEKAIQIYGNTILGLKRSFRNGKVPSAYDVLACLQKYDVGTFKNFCDEFGYNTDSIKAENTYKAVVNEYQSLCTLYSDAELEKLQEIQ